MITCHICRKAEPKAQVTECWHTRDTICAKVYNACYPCIYELAGTIAATPSDVKEWDKAEVIPL